MVSESNQTSWPHQPCASKVAAVLTAKVMAMPSATGRSMLMRRAARSRQATEKKGPQEKNTTGRLSTQEAQRSSSSTSGVISPGPAT